MKRRATPLERVAWALMAGCAWAVLVTARRLSPDARGFGTHEQLGIPPCGFEAAVGFPCPGCGLTTSFAHVMHGHFVAAFHAHLMGPPLCALTLVVALYAPFAMLAGRPVRTLYDARLALPALTLTAILGVLTAVVRVVASLT